MKSKIGMDIQEFPESANIFNKLKVRKDKIPMRPLTEGKLK